MYELLAVHAPDLNAGVWIAMMEELKRKKETAKTRPGLFVQLRQGYFVAKIRDGNS